MKTKDLPVGVMDSGIGGLSILKEARKILPKEDFIYFGDSKNAPYGMKTTEEIKKLTFDAFDYLNKKGIKAFVVACNTATGAAIKELRDAHPEMPIIGVEPAVKPAVVCNQGGEIIVMATPATLRQDKFKDLLSKYENEAKIVTLGCDGLVELIENGNFDRKVIFGYLNTKLGPLLSENVESIVLGCTHYPFIKDLIKEFLTELNAKYEKILLIDGSKGTSSEIKRRLEKAGFLKENGEGSILIENSLEGIEKDKILELSKRLLEI